MFYNQFYNKFKGRDAAYVGTVTYKKCWQQTMFRWMIKLLLKSNVHDNILPTVITISCNVVFVEQPDDCDEDGIAVVAQATGWCQTHRSPSLSVLTPVGNHPNVAAAGWVSLSYNIISILLPPNKVLMHVLEKEVNYL